jgi:predicted GNAT superfamily acetyltransferase
MSKRTLLSQAVKPKAEAPTPADAADKPGGRAGTRMLGFHVPEPVQRQFKVLAAEQGKTVHDLLREAVNDLFRKHGKSPIA